MSPVFQHPPPEYRQHRTIPTGEFAPGAVIAQAATIRTVIPIASSSRLRVRFKATVAGSLTASFLSPGVKAGEYMSFHAELDGSDAASTQGAPTPVAVTANTEAMLEIGDLCGEAFLLLEFEEGGVGAGEVTYCNVCQL